MFTHKIQDCKFWSKTKRNFIFVLCFNANIYLEFTVTKRSYTEISDRCSLINTGARWTLGNCFNKLSKKWSSLKKTSARPGFFSATSATLLLVINLMITLELFKAWLAPTCVTTIDLILLDQRLTLIVHRATSTWFPPEKCVNTYKLTFHK